MIGINSTRIRDNKEKVLSLWEERCLKGVPSAGAAASLALRNSLPIYLDHLSDALATNRKMDVRSVLAHDLESIRIGKLRGADRADNTGYVLTEVISEYHILREVIFQFLETDGQLDKAQRDIILDSIEQAVNDAAVKFSDVHADIHQKFTDTMTHDLKTPITSAKMNAQMLMRRSDLPEPVVNAIKRITVSMNRLDAMIHDLLDASRVRAGEQLQLQFVQCDLEAVIRDVVDEMAIIHGDRFVLDSNEALEGDWGCDGLRRTVENLVGNAVKYGNPQSPITVTLRRGETAVEVAVHNQGPSISKNEIPLLFKNLRRSKSAQEGKQAGWGLGLTLVKGVVDAHNGNIRVESAEGKGTSFILEIPFGKAAAAVSEQKTAKSA